MANREQAGWDAAAEATVETEENAIVDDAEAVETDEVEEPEEQIKASKLRDASRKEMDATRLYLKEIEFSELLTADEEKFYTRKAQAGCDKSPSNVV